MKISMPVLSGISGVKTRINFNWEELGKKRAIDLFKNASRSVPAYRDFLKKNSIQPDKIKTFADFQQVPPISKENYLLKYPLDMLSWNGTLNKNLVYTSSSGSTGNPVYFPRSVQLDEQASVIHQIFLENGRTKGPVLVIVGFGMGVWIGGLITYRAFELAAGRSKISVSLITPGTHKTEILKALKYLSPKYAQTILAGYPPFIKEVLDAAHEQSIPLGKFNMRLLFAAEAFTEKFRDYVKERTFLKNIMLDTMSIYGTADLGAMAFESPVSILVRRAAAGNKQLFDHLFDSIYKTPTLAQFCPLFANFESDDGKILVTGDNAVPLVRYDLGDQGGVMTFQEVEAKLKNNRVDLNRETEKNGIKNYIQNFPFVYVYERRDMTVKLHLRDIFPEIIKDVLIKKPFDKFLTGKFTLETKYNEKNDQYLEINLELRKMPPDKKTRMILEKNIHEAICTRTTGPANQDLRNKKLVETFFWPAEHPKYFKSGIKQKWVTNR